jgi:hypothetical protein
MDAGLDDHPKALIAGYDGVNVFDRLIRLNGRYGFDGRIPAQYVSPAYLAARSQASVERISEGLSGAVRAQLIRVEDNGDVVIVGWDDWKPASTSADRMRIFRERQAARARDRWAAQQSDPVTSPLSPVTSHVTDAVSPNVTCDVVMPSESESESESESDLEQEQEKKEHKKKTKTPARVRDGEPEAAPGGAEYVSSKQTLVLEIYQAYPRKLGKARGLEALTKLSTEQLSTVLGRARAFAADCQRLRTATEYIPHFATWVRQRRWEDEQSANGTGARARASPGGATAADIYEMQIAVSAKENTE